MPHVPLIPYYTVKIKSDLTVEQARKAIENNTDSEFRWRSSNLFWGEVSQDKFKITRYTKGRNSFLPFIRGTILAHGEGSEIEIAMRPQFGVMIAIGMLAVVFISTVKMNASEILISLTLVFLFYAVMYVFGFLLEQKRAEHLLKTIFITKE